MKTRRRLASVEQGLQPQTVFCSHTFVTLHREGKENPPFPAGFSIGAPRFELGTSSPDPSKGAIPLAETKTAGEQAKSCNGSCGREGVSRS
jgi:hypothetical protein